MASFDSGCKGFVKAYAVVTVNFPIDWKGNADIACKHCPFYRYASRECGLNKSIVNYPDTRVGVDCPLIEVDEEKE